MVNSFFELNTVLNGELNQFIAAESASRADK